MRSTAFPALAKIGFGGVGIPDDGAMVASDTCVFRRPARDGYTFMQDPVTIAVLGITLPNLVARYSCNNLEARGSPRGPLSKAEYVALVKPKIEAVLNLADRVSVETLVVSDEGLMELNNNPELFGKAMAMVFATMFDLKMPKIIVAGSHKFRNGVRQAMTDIKRDPISGLKV